ncbi:DUF368 domain-containing protein [Halanaerobaculum tunisiense]
MEEESKIESVVKLMIKGIPIGMSNTLPGVSGGTMALVLGIYDVLIKGLKKIRLRIIGPIFIGAVVGVLGSSKLITSLLEWYPNLVKSFLLGLIFASSKITLDQVKEFNFVNIILGLIGLALALFYSVELGATGVAANGSWLQLFFGGAVGSVAMILPGISGGTILIMLGLYQTVLTGISNFNLPLLIVFGAGVGSGLLGFSWLLSYLLNNFRSLLMAFLTGLILGSMRSVLLGQVGIGEIICFLGGVGVIYLLARKGE